MKRALLIVGVLLGLGVIGVGIWKVHTHRRLLAEGEMLRRDIGALEADRDQLRARLDAGVSTDPRLEGMPRRPLRVGVPVSLLSDLTTRLVTTVAGQVTIELGGMRVRRSGTIRRVLPLGEYQLDVHLTRVSARLKADPPQLRFGGNRIDMTIPIRVLSGVGEANVHFVWDGRTLGGAVCGDMEVNERVSGTVAPRRYTLRGAVHLRGTADAIIARPQLPRQRIQVHVTPSRDSWAAVQKILDSKGGLCGFVLDRVNIAGVLDGLLKRGFSVRLPTERIAPVSLPVGITPTVQVNGAPMTFAVTAVPPVITSRVVWLGADVTVPESVSGQRTP